MDDKPNLFVREDHSDEGPDIFPETETRRIAERYAPKVPGVTSVSAPRAVAIEGVRAIEQELRRPLAPPPPPDIDSVLSARISVHGDFTNDARTSQALKHVMHEAKNWDDLTFVQKEALELIATKIGRILSGDPNHADHWSDIQGYARLVEKRL